MKSLFENITASLRALLILTVLLCGIYPITIWLIGQTVFPKLANGSIVVSKSGTTVGSELIGQMFADSCYFHSRSSAAGNGYDATASGGSNLGPLSKKLAEQIQDRIMIYRSENRLKDNVRIPADAVTASGSGLDPDISVENALLQAERIASVRHLDKQFVVRLVRENTRQRQFGFFGERRVNVLNLNLSLDRIKP